MSWVSTAARRSQLRGMISDYTNKLTRITDDLRNLQTYASATSDGMVTYDELGELSADYHETALAYNDYAFTVASQSAEAKTNQYMAMNQINDMNTHNMCYNSYLESELQAMATINAERIRAEEKKLINEQETTQSLLAAVQSEYDSIKDAVDKQIQNDAIKLTA